MDISQQYFSLFIILLGIIIYHFPLLCLENLSPAGESVSRVPLNASDRDLAESLPLIRDILSQTDNSSTSSKFSHPPAAAALPQPPPSATADGVSCICYLYVWLLVHFLADSHLKASDFVTNMYLSSK